MRRVIAAVVVMCILFGVFLAVKAIVIGFLLRAAIIAAAFAAVAIGITLGNRTAWRRH